MHQGERRLHVGILQVHEHRRDLAGREHALVGQRARRQAHDVEGAPVRGRERVDGVFDALADDEQLALEVEAVGRRASGPGRHRGRRPERAGGGGRGPADEDLPEQGRDRHRTGAERRGVGGDIAPPEELLPFLADDARDQVLDAATHLRLAREKDQAGAVGARRRQCEAQPLRLAPEEAVRHLQQDAGAVAGVRLAAARAAVLEVDEHLQGMLDDGVRGHPLQMRDEADATRVVLEAWIVEAMRPGSTVVLHSTLMQRPRSVHRTELQHRAHARGF